MKKIDQAIAVVEEKLEWYRNPGTYMDSEYYTRCDAKVDVLEDVLHQLKSIKEGRE